MAQAPKTADETPFEQARNSVLRIADFDSQSLVRQDDLGAKGAFHGAVVPANKIKTLFSRLPVEALNEFPESELISIKKNADGVYNLFQQILDFDPDQGEPANRRDQLIAQIEAQYQPVFTFLMPFVSYAVAREVDWDKLSSDGRAAVQSVRDEVATVVEELNGTHTEANRILQEVRDAAAEQGVTQQAKYFEKEADDHETKSEEWKKGTFKMAGVVVAYAVLTLFFPLIPWFKADSNAEAIQLTTSKVLIFFVLASVFLLFVRNFTAHKHNAIVNKHRQNALMTYTTLAEAGSTSEARDTVLQHAAAAIYSPNDSGYVKSEDRGYSTSLPVAVSPRFPNPGTGGEG